MWDFVIIGAGIAGASVAAHLAPHARVLILEAEAQPGHHATGRSAAMFAPGYGPAPIRALTRASAAFFDAPPAGFAAAPLLTPRATVMITTPDQMDSHRAALADLSGDAAVTELTGAEVEARVPLLRPGYAVAGILDATGSDIDVHALHHGFLRMARAAGAELRTRATVAGLTRQAGGWAVETAQGVEKTRAVINAAGAWAGQVGAMAGAEAIGLTPKRRTALIVAAPVGVATADLPLTVDIDETFYLKPDAGRLLISPANEDPMEPCDVQPDELDVAYCIDRIERAFDLSIRRIEHRWAGLRSFVADKAPVVGYSPLAPGFFWLAGQGGYGIQSSPALGRLAAALALGQDMPADLAAQGLRLADLAPDRPALR